jgi:trehalose 6-phosphate phosphatase
LEAAPDWALFLDVDGTLLHFADTPDAVEVGEHLHRALERLAPLLGGALALISGRRIADLDRLFAPLVLPIAGLHGLERRDAGGTLHRLADEAGLDELRGPLAEFAAAHPGVLLEDKGQALALHYRRAPAAEGAARQLVERLAADRLDRLRVLDGKMVLEIKPRLANKGAAIGGFMGEAPFAGRRPVFAGDDVTDEDGFAVVNGLGGASIRVGDEGPSEAVYRLEDVQAVMEWLEALPGMLGACRAGERR